MTPVLPRALRRLALLVSLAALAGCTHVAAPDRPATALMDDARPASDLIQVVPRDRARGVPADGRLEVRSSRGVLERVRVSEYRADGIRRTVSGRIQSGGHTWRPAGGRLDLAAHYTVDAVARDGSGRRTVRHTGFSTYVPEHRFIGSFSPEAGSTVGTGMIVSFGFSRPVADRAAVERAIRVTAQPAQRVAAHWFGPTRLDFRPRTYWLPGTVVTMDLRLRDVRSAPGVYGLQRKTVRFTVGRSQVSTVDAARHTMTVVRDGRPVATVPITAGRPGSETYGGKLVISEKFPMTRMNGDTVGFGGEYDISDVPHAMRLTASGTFLHGNYWAEPDVFGTRNTSHGCIGLPDVRGGGETTPAGRFYASSLLGDVVEVVGSGEPAPAPDNGLSGWNLTWEQWLAGSALRGAGGGPAGASGHLPGGRV
ncbi:lipoprotein [Streptomyces mashuensis]|uniref:Lipoprotein n=1 Tax=Streptomyces mashuensis TaxID=33904 RepID=A0A919B3P8_9ACTN|nr:Ig-like domain-containing protein [Streptomyces mashuensis]GHF50200.1 lipoprotein [Streptomyces mashuensis]